MDKIGIHICRVYCALNKLHTAGLTDKELEELSDKVISIIDKATGSNTPELLHYKPNVNGKDIKDNKDSNNEDKTDIKDNNTNKIEKTNRKLNRKSNISPEQIALDLGVGGGIGSDTSGVEDKRKNSKNDTVVNSPDPSTEKKRVRWDCNTCISKCDKEKDDSVSICNECYRIFERTGKTNHYYQRSIKEVPSSCKGCKYCSYLEEFNKYVCNVNYKLEGEIGSYHHYIRANYREKNRPPFCKCK